MAELIGTLTIAISVLKSVREFQNSVRTQISKTPRRPFYSAGRAENRNGGFDRKHTLKRKIAVIEGGTGKSCPGCDRVAFRVKDSGPHPAFGELGGLERTMLCDTCGFTENEMRMPNR